MHPIAVILPAYNEELTIRQTMLDFHRALPDAAIFVVDNRSSDGTGRIASATLKEIAAAGAVLFEARPGKGNALRRAFLEVDAEYYIVSDADTTYPADRARDLLQPLLDRRADMVVGDRLSDGDYARENKRPLHGFGNHLVQSLVNRLFNARLVDIMSGYRAFTRRFVKNYPILVEGFQIETDMTLHALDKRFQVVEIPVAYRDRPSGSVSKLNTLSDGAKVLGSIFQILRHYRPLYFFGGMALMSMLAGLACGTPVVLEWLETGLITRLPLAVLATGLEIVGVVLGAIGLILDSLIHSQKMAYERGLLSQASDR